ncbi:MAG: hypothetical protein POELPBGB_00488 [Bacteroidia bacterium]|nr:hypothetical protein [Bacteroidia bacterium]
MNIRIKAFLLLIAVMNMLFFQVATATNPDFEQRRTAYINTALANPSPDVITIQAYQNGTVDAGYLNSLLAGIETGTTSDFDIVKLIRVLYFTNGTYDSEILPVLNSVPYWLTKDEAQRTYWSENHLIMWMGSDWLLHERYGRAIDPTLEQRLKHYLNMKVQYGFYEFFSSVYAPYCLTGLLNLADFAEDTEIKTLAAQAAQLLLKDILMITNDKGVFFPAAGRNYFGKYDSPYGQNHNNLIYLLTGFGDAPGGASHAGGFLASSTLDVDAVIDSWTAELDTVYSIGHTLEESFALNSALTDVDRILAQWSGGAYFHPLVALESGHLIEDSNLWNHVDMSAFAQFQSLNVEDFPTLAVGASAISKSSVIMGQNVAIFKHNAVTLSSVQDFWKGKVGYQQMPVVANLGTTAVLTASGEVVAFDERGDANENSHLPYVKQQSNVALVMYRPDPTLPFFGQTETSVTLRWMEADFDETRTSGNWLLGREDNGYIGVRRSCTTQINNMIACDNPEGQTWVFMVGDSAMYGNFDNFQSVIDASQFEEEWYLDTVSDQWVYYAGITIDTISIDYAWNQDSSSTGIFSAADTEPDFNVYPNPATDKVTIDLTALEKEEGSITVVNAIGETVFAESKPTVTSNVFTLNTAGWVRGVYFFTVKSNEAVSTRKVVLH